MANQRKLGRTADQRKALLRNQVTNLIWNGRITTTEAKAKEVSEDDSKEEAPKADSDAKPEEAATEAKQDTASIATDAETFDDFSEFLGDDKEQ